MVQLPDGAQSPATLQDVARLAGVSAKTAARALNGEAHVRPETRDRVLQAATKLRFRPNRLARELRQGARTKAVALVIGSLDNPFYAGIGAGLERKLRESDLEFELLIASTDDDPDREVTVVRGLLERRVQGLVIVPAAQDHTYLEGERQWGMPIVFIDRPSQTLAADCVLRDNRGGVAAAVGQFTALGHRRIAVISDTPALFTATERLIGFEQAMHDARLDIDPSLVRTGAYDTSAAHKATEELLALPNPPTAILAMNNRISVGALEVLLARQSAVAFIGFDDFDLAPVLKISVVTNDPLEMGEQAGMLVLDGIRREIRPPRRVILPSVLLARGSGERVPAAEEAEVVGLQT